MVKWLHTVCLPEVQRWHCVGSAVGRVAFLAVWWASAVETPSCNPTLLTLPWLLTLWSHMILSGFPPKRLEDVGSEAKKGYYEAGLGGHAKYIDITFFPPAPLRGKVNRHQSPEWKADDLAYCLNWRHWWDMVQLVLKTWQQKKEFYQGNSSNTIQGKTFTF